MKLIWYNIREIIRSHKALGLIIVLVPFLCTFAIFFATGILVNNEYQSGETKKTTMVDVQFRDYPQYDDVERMTQQVYQVVEDEVIVCFSMFVLARNHNQDLPHYFYKFPVILGADYEEGQMVPNDSFYYRDDLREGRRLTAEDFASEVPCGIARDLPKEPLIVEGREVKVVGRKVGSEESGSIFPWLTVNPAFMQGLEIISTNYYLNRSLFQDEFQSIVVVLDEHCEGNYKILYTGTVDGDEQAMRKTASCACALILMTAGYTLLMLYRYLVNYRAYKMAVCRLLGCSRRENCKILFGELLAGIVPAVLLGVLAFLICQKTFLKDIYPYIDPVFTPAVYSGMTLGILAVLTVVCFLFAMYYSRYSVKSQLSSFKK